MASNSTKEGKIKNPIRPLDAKNFLFQSEDAEEMKRRGSTARQQQQAALQATAQPLN